MNSNSKLHPVIRKPLDIVNKMIDRIIGVLGAFIFAQVPQFIGQYTQRLGGHIDELKRIIGQYSAAAKTHGLTLEQYIQKHVASKTPEFSNTGEIMQNNLARFEDLHQALQNLTTATPYNKLFFFLKDIDFEIYKAVYHNYTPGIPTTREGIIYTVIGIFFAIFLYYTIKKALQKLIKKIFNKIKKKKTPKTQTPIHFDDQQLNDFDFKGPF